MGFEIELLAPVGRSRKDLAVALAEDVGGEIRRCFYPQSEPSLVPNTPVFHNLVLGYDTYDREGRRYARCVDDLTLQADLDRNAAAKDCRRLGNLPEKLFELTQQSDFASLSWRAAQARLKELSLSKFVDFNVLNLVHDVPEKPTFEVRILPGSMDMAQIVDQAMLFEAILKWCVAPGTASMADNGIADFVTQLPAPEERKRNWIERVR